MSSFYKIGFFRIKYIRYKFLGISVNKRKPTALNLHHQAMTFHKGVAHIRNFKMNFSYFARNKRLRFFKTFAVSSSEYLTAHQLLVPALKGCVRINVYKFHNPIGI